MSNTLLIFIGAISVVYGFWAVVTLLSSLPILYDLDVFADPALQPDTSGQFAIVETCLAAAVLAIGVGIGVGV